MSTVAMYFFQGEAGESQEYPNAFVIPNTAKPTLGTFLNYFPAHEKGALHFRFRMEDSGHEYVWLDVTSRDEVLPFYKDSIMAKVLRTAEAATLKRKGLLRRKNMEHLAATIVNGGAAAFSKSAEPATAPAAPARRSVERKPEPQVANTSSNNSGASKNQYERNVYPSEGEVSPAPAAIASNKQASQKATPTAKPAPPPAPAPAAVSPDILDFEPTSPNNASQEAPAPGKAPNAAPVSDMMDFDEGPVPPQSSSQKHSNADLASMIDLDGAPTASRAELKATRQDQINQQVQAALDEKIEIDRKAVQEQLDFDTARAVHDQKLLAWSTNNKERRNIRSLLSTMHTVLWPDSRWKTIGLGDLLEPKQVKMQYRKAMLVVHPDHNVKLSNENKYISKRIFEAVNEAYNEFTTKENV